MRKVFDEQEIPKELHGYFTSSVTGGRRNGHNTLKPIRLTEYLAKLLLPPPRKDGSPRRIVIPFAGAGSEMIGAMRAGYEDIVGIEADFDNQGFVDIARARIARWKDIPPEMTVAEVRATAEAPDARQVSLFGLFEGKE